MIEEKRTVGNFFSIEFLNALRSSKAFLKKVYIYEKMYFHILNYRSSCEWNKVP